LAGGFYLRFLGGAREVGRSSVELGLGSKSLILDSGVHVGAKTPEDRYPLQPSGEVEALIVTHAHLDHSGFSPALVRDTGCPIYSTPPTRDVSELLLVDFLSLQGQSGEDKPYENEDVMRLRSLERPVSLRSPFEIGDATVTLYDAGHVLGSAMVRIEIPETFSILYTGDLNLGGTRTLSGADTDIPPTDYVIIESTYGGDGDAHPARKKVERKFIFDVRETVSRGGKVVIPCFALGRAQEVLLTLLAHIDSGSLPPTPIFVDGMIVTINRIYSLYWSWLRPELQRKVRLSKRSPFDHELVEEVRDREEILEITEPYIVVTTSGMLQGGPVVDYLRGLAGDSRNLIYLTGYQVRGTRGRALLEGQRRLTLDEGEEIEVRARVEFAEFSAHSDQSGLIAFLSHIPGVKEVFVVHGEPEKSRQLSMKLESRGTLSYVPRVGERVALRA